MSLTLQCFLFALRLIYSVCGSLFLHWTFFVCAITSSVSGCFRVLLLQSRTRSDLRFSLSDEIARWDESLLFLFAPSSSTPVVSSGFGRMFHFFLLVSVSGIFSLPSSFCLDSFRSLHLWVSFPSYFLCFSFSSAFLTCSLPFPFFRFLHGVLCGFLPWLGVFPFRISLPSFLCLSMLGPFGFRSSYLGSGVFLWALLHLPCASSPYCLFWPWAFPSLPHYWFLSPRSFSSLCLSAWCFMYFLGGFSSGFSFVSSSGGSLLSFLPSCRAAATSSLVSLPLSFRVHSFHGLW